ncbi:non-ribosomal peptide synthetase [Streptomyces sp. NY05-11A]|uniref:non-ribosomal peptide synthetase n=1 Tax=Streptomyces soliscabiei TaxID=588897 RepID=UPI0029A622ED|nr:amino acid adenylation domain-containing protein [Streptomyces sp. NY05-11A]MDX2679231.1 amino acid adenylation domain-containing protein [Streptomyces sp. NY05-11A]
MTTQPVAGAELLGHLARSGITVKLVGEDRIEVTAPRGSLSDDLRSQIRDHKQELVEWLIRERDMAGHDTGLPVIEPDQAGLYEPFPPSDLQMSFLIGGREELEYHVRPHQYMEMDFDELDPERFEQALNRMLKRQAKSLVEVREDLQLQTVRNPSPVPVQVLDLRHRTPDEAHAEIERVRAEMRSRELPLDRWPWMDVRITLYGEGRARLHYNNNNFFSDGPGTGRFLDSVLGTYSDPEAAMPDLEIGYRDCVLALEELEKSELGEASKAYWCRRMADWPEAPALPLVAGADTRTRAQLERRDFILPATTWARLKRNAAMRGLTPTNAVYGAYAEVASRWSGSRHFLLNNMITHRLPLHPQIGEVVGNFASLYPLEADWTHDESFEDRCRRLQAQVMADMEHTYWSGVKVLQTLNQVRRTPGRAVCPFVVGSGLFMGHMDRPVHSHLETPQVLLDNQFWEQSDGSLWVVWDLIEDMFPSGLIDAMHAAYQFLLQRLADDDSSWRLEGFDLLPAEQRARRERENRVTQQVPEGLLHTALSQKATELPDKPAVLSSDGTLTYAELHARGRRIAELLREQGVRRRDMVAVVLPKSREQIAAVYGALMADAAYVPIDPGWPHERIRQLLTQTGARAVLTDQGIATTLRDLAECSVLAVDGAQAAEPATAPLTTAAEPGDVAYVIYTSGSSGTPKGAVLNHRGPLNTIADINRRFGIDADDVVFGVSSLCFDLSVYDVFGTAATGATLLLPPNGQSDPHQWLESVVVNGVTVWNSVPALMQLFVEAAETAGVQLPELRTVLLSGDWIPVSLPARIRAIAPHARVISLGGATEASIWSIHYPIDQMDPNWVSIPYGKPLANQSWRVLDATGRDAPDWVPGELYIGGTGVALGYWDDRERTAASFVPGPRGSQKVLYRTGDLGRYLPDGNIEFLGRADFQVKIQGFRVEPGEIEYVLAEHEDVQQAVVVARSLGAGKQLAAYVVGQEGRPRPEPAELLDQLGRRLPSYLVPSFVTVLDQLPLTGNGKLDRKALEALGPSHDVTQPSYTAPRNDTEKTLVAIWASVLELEQIGVHDDFFDLGGQSFAALRVLGQVKEQLGRRVPLGALMERRTISALAELLEETERDWSPLVALREDIEGTPWFLAHPAGGNVLCYRGLADHLDGPSYAFQAPGPAVGRAPLQTVEELAALYADALRTVQPYGPYRLGGWSSGAVIALEMAHLLEQRGETVERLAVIDSPAPVEPGETDETTTLLWFLEDLDIGFDPTIVGPEDFFALSSMAEDERLDRALELARRQPLAVPDLDVEGLRLTWPVFQGIIRAGHSYRAAQINADVTVVQASRGRVSEFIGHPHADSSDWGWSALTRGQAVGAVVDGTHHTLLTDRHVTDVAAVLVSCRAHH